MLSWLKSQCTHAEEYVTLRKRVTDLELRIIEMETFQDAMRNMARKIQTRKPKTEEEDTESTDLKTSVLVAV